MKNCSSRSFPPGWIENDRREEILKHDQRYVWLDFIRGTCALLVCAGHLRAVAIVDYANGGAGSFATKGFYFMTGLQHQAVMVFFVLSGFFVGGAVVKNRHRFDPRNYAVARLTRLWTVLIPALLATAMVDAVVRAFAPEVLQGQFRSVWNSGPAPDALYSVSFPTLLANVFFLQTITAPVFGTNGPLWSLANEFWYYVIFPLGVVALCGKANTRDIRPVYRLLCAAGMLAMVVMLPAGMREGLYVWMMGVMVFISMQKLDHMKAAMVTGTGFLLLLAALVGSKFNGAGHLLNLSSDMVIGAAFAVLAVGLVNGNSRPGTGTCFEKLARLISDFSYSLYLIHFPLVVLIGALFYKQQLPPDAKGLALFALWLMVLLICGALFYHLFERRTGTVREWISKKIPGSGIKP